MTNHPLDPASDMEKEHPTIVDKTNIRIHAQHEQNPRPFILDEFRTMAMLHDPTQPHRIAIHHTTPTQNPWIHPCGIDASSTGGVAPVCARNVALDRRNAQCHWQCLGGSFLLASEDCRLDRCESGFLKPNLQGVSESAVFQ